MKVGARCAVCFGHGTILIPAEWPVIQSERPCPKCKADPGPWRPVDPQTKAAAA